MCCTVERDVWPDQRLRSNGDEAGIKDGTIKIELNSGSIMGDSTRSSSQRAPS